ncbi:hypothetical protein LRS06_18730 [Hymenobacter sp. J193]|nr:hypothetical protein [Hymenobacter sp. J193]MCR5889766.1 hypothetical protein [Hymenobacter sp. J193]
MADFVQNYFVKLRAQVAPLQSEAGYHAGTARTVAEAYNTPVVYAIFGGADIELRKANDNGIGLVPADEEAQQ